MSGIITSGRYAGWIAPDHRNDDPDAVPIFGVQPFVRAELRRRGRHEGDEPRPGLDGKAPVEVAPPCPHKGPIPVGSECYCARCDAYGREYDKRLIRDPATDPKPEPKVETPPEPEPTRAEKTGRKTSGKMAKRNARKRAEAEAVATGEAA